MTFDCGWNSKYLHVIMLAGSGQAAAEWRRSALIFSKYFPVCDRKSHVSLVCATFIF